MPLNPPRQLKDELRQVPQEQAKQNDLNCFPGVNMKLNKKNILDVTLKSILTLFLMAKTFCVLANIRKCTGSERQPRESATWMKHFIFFSIPLNNCS